MKKLFALLLAFGMLAMLCACSSGTEGTGMEAQTEKAVEAPAEDKQLAALKGILGSAVSLDDYELFSQDEDYVTLYSLDGERIELDYTVDLDDGTTIQLPMVYGELLDAGWTSSVQWKSAVEGNSMGSASHANAEGETIYLAIINPTSKSMYLTDIWINQVQVGGDYTEGFDIHGVSAGSTIADVVAAWGNPYEIEYSSDKENAYLDLGYLGSDYGTLSFRVDVKTGQVRSAHYLYSSNNIG